jgi:hypothetical protein
MPDTLSCKSWSTKDSINSKCQIIKKEFVSVPHSGIERTEQQNCVRFQVLTAAIVKFRRVFSDEAPCSHVEVDFNVTTRRYIPEDSKLH